MRVTMRMTVTEVGGDKECPEVKMETASDDGTHEITLPVTLADAQNLGMLLYEKGAITLTLERTP